MFFNLYELGLTVMTLAVWALFFYLGYLLFHKKITWMVAGVSAIVMVMVSQVGTRLMFSMYTGFSFIGFIFAIIMVVGVFYGVEYMSHAKEREESRKYNNWLNAGVSEVKETAVLNKFQDDIVDGMDDVGENIPYGRAQVFASQFDDVDMGSLEIYGFSPIPSQSKLELREYGVLATNQGFLVSYQEDTYEKDKNKHEIFKTYFYHVDFNGLWSIKIDDSYITFDYPGRRIQIDRGKVPFLNSKLVHTLDNFVSSGFTRNCYYLSLAKDEKSTGNSELDKQVRKLFETQQKQAELMGNSIRTGSLMASLGMEDHLNKIQFNSIVNQRQNHGVAAEHGNDVMDRAHGKELWKTIKGEDTLVGQDNAKGGADRVVDGQQYQTKYCRTAKDSVNAYFEKGYQNKGIKLEVARDQYVVAKQEMAKRIARGEIKGESNPDNAGEYLIEGSLTRDQAIRETKPLNIDALKIDALDGALTSIPGASITSILVFIQAKRSGMSIEESAKVSVGAFGMAEVSGTVNYVIAEWIPKMNTVKGLARQLGKESKEIAQYMSYGVTAVITYGPMVVQCLVGRISYKQLIKLATISTAGIVGGVIGETIGSVPGAVIGSFAGAALGKAVMDEFVKDDAEEMYQIIKEEYMDTVLTSGLNEDERKEMINRVFANKKLPRIMRDMFAADDSRKYARKYLMEDNIVDLYKQREAVTDEDINEGLKEQRLLLSQV